MSDLSTCANRVRKPANGETTCAARDGSPVLRGHFTRCMFTRSSNGGVTSHRFIMIGETQDIVHEHVAARAECWRDSSRTQENGNARSLLAQNEIDDPTAANVRPRPAAVVENGHFLAPGVLEGVGQDGHRGEVAGVVHASSELSGGGGAPGGVERSRGGRGCRRCRGGGGREAPFPARNSLFQSRRAGPPTGSQCRLELLLRESRQHMRAKALSAAVFA